MGDTVDSHLRKAKGIKHMLGELKSFAWQPVRCFTRLWGDGPPSLSLSSMTPHFHHALVSHAKDVNVLLICHHYNYSLLATESHDEVLAGLELAT